METPLFSLSFNLNDWAHYSLGAHTEADWYSWVQMGEWPQASAIVFDRIPAMTRRRMSMLSKLAVQTALTLLERNQVDYLIFASRHGELHRTVDIINSILQSEPASPMAFSQSVHNTAAGLATIISKQPLPLTSISAGDNTFHSALIEAYAYLSDNPEHKVMVIDFDQMLPKEYQEFERQQFPDYGLGFVLSQGNQWQVSVMPLTSSYSASDSQSVKLPISLQSLRALLAKQNAWHIYSHDQSQCWQWQYHR